MKIPNSTLHIILRALQQYVKNAEDIEKIVITHALGAAAAAVAAGWIPGAGGAIATGIAISFTLTMYYRLCKECGITMKKNIMKAVVSVAVAEIAAYFSVIIVTEIALSFIPGLGNVATTFIAGFVNFAMVYIAGLLFLMMMVKVFKAKKSVENMSEEELKEYMKESATKENIAKMYKEAKETYKSAKDDPSYSTDDVKPTNPDDDSLPD